MILAKHQAIVRRERRAVGREVLQPLQMGGDQLVPSRNTNPRRARNLRM
jgi:hypothetical protein